MTSDPIGPDPVEVLSGRGASGQRSPEGRAGLTERPATDSALGDKSPILAPMWVTELSKTGNDCGAVEPAEGLIKV